jgi:hypothetical protein
MLAAWGVVQVGACRQESEPFLPLSPSPCEERSLAICAARAEVCEDAQEISACTSFENDTCEEGWLAYADEASLRYDGVLAARVRRDEQRALDRGEPPFSLAQYFTGGWVVDAPCVRDSQCETGCCDADTGRCAELPEAALCEPAEGEASGCRGGVGQP